MLAWRPHGVHGGITASLPRPYGVSTVLARGVIIILLRSHRLYYSAPMALLWRSYGVPTALLWRSYCVHLRLQGAETALPVRCEQTQHKWYKCSLVNHCPPHLCPRPHHGCFTPARRATPCLYAGPAVTPGSPVERRIRKAVLQAVF